MKTQSIAILLLIAFSVAAAGPQTGRPQNKLQKQQAPADWVGVYQVEGKEAGGSYFSVCQISKLDGGVFWVTWTSKNTTMRGLGKVLDGKLVVSWKPDDNRGVGMTVYCANVDGLQGQWNAEPGGAAGTETLTPLRAAPGR